MEINLLSLEACTIIVQPDVKEVPYGPYGYLVDQRGIVYVLTHRWFHGVITALLFPNLVEAEGYSAPVSPPEANNVFTYQEFEHKVSRITGLVRIAQSALINSLFCSKGDEPATAVQLEGVAKCMKALGYNHRDLVTTDGGDLKLADLYEQLKQDNLKESE